jgi:hypothetical protein
MLYLAFILLVTLFTANRATDAHSIKQDVVDRIVNDIKSSADDRSIALANYRHRVEHSHNIKALRSTLKDKYHASDYCEACDILTPMVSELNSCISAMNLLYNRCV